MSSISSERTMSAVVSNKVHKVINDFTPAYNVAATPYQKENFHPMVKALCAINRTGRIGLKNIKAVLVGDLCAGLSSLLRRFCHDVFDRWSMPTIGYDVGMEKFSVLSVPITLYIVDLAGSERFRDVTEVYYRIAQIVIVVFDLTDEASLHHTVKRMEEVCQKADDPVKFLVGTKQDLLSPEAYSDIEQKAITYSHQLEAEFWATSSKTGERVHDVFFRAMCISFDALLLKELMANSSASKEIGIGLLNIQESESDSYEKEKKRFQCSS